MLGITYNTWDEVCGMYARQRRGVLESYLQWYPFSLLTNNDWCEMRSEEFYSKYMQNGACLLFDRTLICTDNYIQKGDGSFRHSRLVSPILFLLIQALGKRVSEVYSPHRPYNVDVFYAGNYEEMRCSYKKDYDEFFNTVNMEADVYPYFIKTDIKEFFNNISVDKLFRQIDDTVNADNSQITQTQLLLYKELIQYCGNGRFPIVENSVGLSYLATIVYLDMVDSQLHSELERLFPEICQFKMVRYVDDMYIFIKPQNSKEDMNRLYQKLLSQYSSILRQWGLALNVSKCALVESKEINAELKKSLYDEYYNGQRCEIADLCPNGIDHFLDEIDEGILWNTLTSNDYAEIVSRSFSVPDVEFTPNEVFNYFVYENTEKISSALVAERIASILKEDVDFISYDPKRLTVMIMRCGSDNAIKAFLNRLFIKHRAGLWNSYDTTIAINYLLQSKFRHIDLLDVMKSEASSLSEYVNCFCKQSMLLCFDMEPDRERIRCITRIDAKAIFLYFMYKVEINRGAIMAAYAYYKNYFDRITADMAFTSNYDNNGKKPNYKGFYKESAFAKMYSTLTGIDDVGSIIHKAHDLRNSNPLSHSSADMIDNNDSAKAITGMIKQLEKLINLYCKQNCLIS